METVLNNFCAEGLNVLSCFDGMSCGQLALQKAGIKVNQYYAAEIDKYAIQVTQKNFPNTIQLGDITKVKGADLPKIDLCIGGSPCQGFSFAGKGLNFEDERSKLFFEFVRLINECKPKYWMLENVKMKKEHKLVISQYMKVAPIEINSALVSAQNRVRLYWTNINEKPYGLFGDMMAYIPQPKDKGILLKDILESEVDKKYYLSDNMLKKMQMCDDTGNGIIGYSGSGGQKGSIFNTTNKVGSLCATDYKQPKQICVASRGRNPENPKSREVGLNTEQQLEPIFDGKTNCLTNVQKDNLVMLNERQKANHKNENEKANTFLSTSWKGSQANGMTLVETTRIRRLTPTECERLQTVPDIENNVIFSLCYESAKNYVNAVSQNPKLLKLVLDAEQSELNELVKSVWLNINVNHQSIKYTVPLNADMPIQQQTNQFIKSNPQENNITASSAENTAINNGQSQGGDIVPQNVFISITEGKITHCGQGVLLPNANHYTIQRNGGKPLNMFGYEIMEIVEDVEKNLNIKKDSSSTFTTSHLLNTKNLEQALIIYYLFAKNVIIGYTPSKTQIKNLSLNFSLKHGYTDCVSNTQRYKMLGNGWTVSVVSHIFSYLPKEYFEIKE